MINTKNSRRIKSLIKKIRIEIAKELEILERVDKALYLNTVAKALKHYETIRNVTRKEISELAKELRQDWATLKKQFVEERRHLKKKPRSRKSK